MPYIVHPNLPGQRPDVINPRAWARAGWSVDEDQTPPPVSDGEPEDNTATVQPETEPEAQPETEPAEQPARRPTKEKN